MGTLFEQTVRHPFAVKEESLEVFLERAVELAERYSIEVEDVIRAKHALEIDRQNNIAVDDGNRFDEQIAGIGKMLEGIAPNLEEIADSLKKEVASALKR